MIGGQIQSINNNHPDKARAIYELQLLQIAIKAFLSSPLTDMNKEVKECVWSGVSDNYAVKGTRQTQCGAIMLAITQKMQFKFCPYCGKPIKVEESK